MDVTTGQLGVRIGHTERRPEEALAFFRVDVRLVTVRVGVEAGERSVISWRRPLGLLLGSSQTPTASLEQLTQMQGHNLVWAGLVHSIEDALNPFRTHPIVRGRRG